MGIYQNDRCDLCGAEHVETVGISNVIPLAYGGGIDEVLSMCLKCSKCSSWEEYYEKRDCKHLHVEEMSVSYSCESRLVCKDCWEQLS